jgi:hypothetical protein
MYYTIRCNNSIVAKCDNTLIAAVVANQYVNLGRTVRVINNVYNRVAFNNRGEYFSVPKICEAISDKDQQFCDDACRKASPDAG